MGKERNSKEWNEWTPCGDGFRCRTIYILYGIENILQYRKCSAKTKPVSLESLIIRHGSVRRMNRFNIQRIE